ncbi:MAG: hypothetical protein ACFFA0_05180 [Promethearchaeota archaeon]
MKMLCYSVLIIGFFLFYQQNPIYAVIVITIFIVGYLFIKSRRSPSSGRGLFGFMKGNQQQGNRNFDDLITLMMLQQLMSNASNHSAQDIDITHEESVDKIKKEILDILDL